MSEETQNEPSPSASPSVTEDGGNEPQPEPWDCIAVDFRAFLVRSGVNAKLFNNPSYDKVGALATFESTQQHERGVGHNQTIRGRFTVFVRNRHTSLTNVVKFTDTMLPVTFDEFWAITGGGSLDSSNEKSARVVVKTRTAGKSWTSTAKVRGVIFRMTLSSEFSFSCPIPRLIDTLPSEQPFSSIQFRITTVHHQCCIQLHLWLLWLHYCLIHQEDVAKLH